MDGEARNPFIPEPENVVLSKCRINSEKNEVCSWGRVASNAI